MGESGHNGLSEARPSGPATERGVSVIVCCHNSAPRLPKTLAHLEAQRDTGGVPWEVIVVDNASTDGTAEVARESWRRRDGASLRVVREPHLGLIFARIRGLAEAAHDVVTFVDDDNWVCHDWVGLVARIMDAQPEVGGCLGFCEAACETSPPAWFEQHRGSYAIGPDGLEPGDITWTRDHFWGAGLTVRKSAWERLAGSGFRPQVVGRRGRALSSGEDTELCLALRMAGWRLWYEARLRLQHFLPAGRLTPPYLRRLHRAFGAASVGLDPYLLAAATPWRRQVRDAAGRLLLRRRDLLRPWRHPASVGDDVLLAQRLYGRFRALLASRETYDKSMRRIQDAPWRRASREAEARTER